MQLKKYLSIVLLMAPNVLASTNYAPMIIESPIVKATYGAIPLTKPQALLKRVQGLLDQDYGKNGHVVSLDEIVKHEHMFDASSHEKLVNGCINGLVMILTQEPSLKDPYIKDFRIIQQYLEELITAWADHRGCDATLLRILSKITNNPGQEREILINHIKTIAEYKQLLADAELFLTDFLYTYTWKK